MIIQFKCSNFRSIRDEITFSLLATKDSTLPERVFNYNDRIQILRNAVIYGANGAGKTNILTAMGYIKFLVKNCIKFQEGDTIPYFPHKLADVNTPSLFQIQFIANNNRYAYGLKVTEDEIKEEYLYHFPNGKQAKIFEREEEEYSFGEKYKKELNEIKESKTKKNRLFISTVASWSNLSEIIEPFKYLKDSIVINESVKDGNWMEYTVQRIQKNEGDKKLLLNLLKDMNIGIDEIKAKLDIKDITVESLPNDIPDEIRMILINKKQVDTEVKFKYGKMDIDYTEESMGIQKVFALGGPLIDILKKGKVLIFDELETSLHPYMVTRIIELFNNPKINTKNAQLIFTTHDTNLLDLNVFRRDQIWFVEKDPCKYSSDMYSLADLKNVRKDENIEKGYVAGKYGAIPYLGDNLVTDWLGE